MNTQNGNKEIPILSRGLIFTAVFGTILILWGIASGYHELSLLRHDPFELMTDVQDHPPAYPSLVFLGGLFCIVFVTLSIAGRCLRRFLRRLRPARGGPLPPESR